MFPGKVYAHQVQYIKGLLIELYDPHIPLFQPRICEPCSNAKQYIAFLRMGKCWFQIFLITLKSPIGLLDKNLQVFALFMASSFLFSSNEFVLCVEFIHLKRK